MVVVVITLVIYLVYHGARRLPPDSKREVEQLARNVKVVVHTVRETPKSKVVRQSRSRDCQKVASRAILVKTAVL